MRIARLTLLGCAALAALGILLFAPQPAQAGGSGDDLAEARATYQKMCASCHAKDGSGDTPTGKKMGVRSFKHPDVKKMSDAELTTVTAKGKGKMPGYEKKLSAAQIKDQIRLIRELGK